MKGGCWRRPVLYAHVPGLAALRLGARTTYLNNQYNAHYRDPTGPQLLCRNLSRWLLRKGKPATVNQPELRESAYRNVWLIPLLPSSAIIRHLAGHLPDFPREFLWFLRGVQAFRISGRVLVRSPANSSCSTCVVTMGKWLAIVQSSIWQTL